jgi:hypothetical protein
MSDASDLRPDLLLPAVDALTASDLRIPASREVLSGLLHDLLRLSCTPNEGRYPRMRALLSSAGPRDAMHRTAPALHFDDRHSRIDGDFLRKVAPALHGTDRTLVMSVDGDHLAPVGLYRSEERVIRLTGHVGGPGFSATFSTNRRGSGTLFLIERPGVLGIESLRVDAAHTYGLSFDGLEQRQVDRAGFGRLFEFSPLANQSLGRFVVLVIARLQRAGAGGTLLFAPTLGAALAAGTEPGIYVLGPGISLLHDEGSSTGWSARSLRHLDDALTTIASLAEADGAVLLDQTFTVMGFGAKVAVAKDDQARAKPFGGGMRRTSAAAFCAKVPGATSFVVSEDGHATRFTYSESGAVKDEVPDLSMWTLSHESPIPASGA